MAQPIDVMTLDTVFETGPVSTTLTADTAALMREFGTLVIDEGTRTSGVVMEDLALREALAMLEEGQRRSMARACWLLGRLDESDFSDVGHRSIRGLLAARFQWSPTEIRQRVRIGRAGRQYPRLLEALADGRLPVGHADRLALHLLQHPKLVERPHFEVELEHWLRRAQGWEYDQYRRKLTEWGMIADPQDTAERSAQQRRARRVSMRQRDDGMLEVEGLLEQGLSMRRWPDATIVIVDHHGNPIN